MNILMMIRGNTLNKISYLSDFFEKALLKHKGFRPIVYLPHFTDC